MIRTRKILVIILSLVLVCSLAISTAFATAPADWVYNKKTDMIFEDFDRLDVSDTVTLSAENSSVGEQPYLHVEFDANSETASEKCDTPDDAIYKQGKDASGGISCIVIVMRTTDAATKLEDIRLGLRYGDSYEVCYLPFDELVDGDAQDLPELTTSWQTYVVNISNSYDGLFFNDNTGAATTVSAATGEIVGMHVSAVSEHSGEVEIQSVYVTTDDTDSAPASRVIWNQFVGGATVDETKAADSWWAGSSTGYIVKRALTLNKNGSADILNAEKASGNYAYAVIEATGDTANLTVATTADGTTWGEAKAYSRAMAIDGVCGFRFSYTGESNTTITRIYFSDCDDSADVAATVYPSIDGANTAKFEDFNVPQASITDDYDSMSAVTTNAAAGIAWRLSYSNGSMVSVANGALKIDASSLASEGYINFKTQINTPVSGYQYVVFKVKATDGANLDGFRFGLGSGGSTGNIRWGNGQLFSANQLTIAKLDATNPYATADGWYYVLVDISASELDNTTTTFDTLDLYYSGTGVLYVDEIFFANEAMNMQTALKLNDSGSPFIKAYEPTGEGYAYLGYVYAPNEGKYDYMVIEYTLSDTTDLSGIRLQFVDGKTAWFSENAEGTFVCKDGSALVTSGAGSYKAIIDLEASGIDTNFTAFHIHSNGAATGNFEITDAYLANVCKDEYNVYTEYDYSEAERVDLTGLERQIAPTADGYEYIVCVEAANSGNNYLWINYSLAEGANMNGIRFEFRDAQDVAIGDPIWFDATQARHFVAANGNAIPTQGAGTYTVVIDLTASGLSSLDFVRFHVHSNGASTGVITINDAYLYSSITLNDSGSPFIKAFTPAAAGYEYLGYVYAPNYGAFNGLYIEYTLSEGADLSGIRLGMGSTTMWFAENAEGTLVKIDGSALTVTGAGQYSALIDLDACGADLNFEGFHIHSNGAATGNFEITDAKLVTIEAVEHKDKIVVYDYEGALALDALEKEYALNTNAYTYLTYVSAPNAAERNFLKLKYTLEEGADISHIRIEFRDASDVAVATIWFDPAQEYHFVTADGSAITLTGAGDYEVIIDLTASGLTDLAIGGIHAHASGDEGSFEITEAMLVGDSNYYEIAMRNLPVYEVPDIVAPTVDITTATTAETGDTITIAYTASDDVTTDLTVEISVVDASANAVTLSATNSFTAAEGTYTVTVTVSDAAGNEATDTIQITVTTPDTTAPMVDITTATTAKAEDTITVTYTASDNVTTAANLTAVIEVKNQEGEVVALTNNSFVADTGTYTIKVTVSDEAGNEAYDTITLEVAKKGCGSSIGLVSGAALLAVVALAAVVLKKKED